MPAALLMAMPTSVDPVNEISRGVACVAIAVPISSPLPTITLITPAGSPASSRIFASSNPPVTGVSLAGLRTSALPTARAGATVRLVR